MEAMPNANDYSSLWRQYGFVSVQPVLMSFHDFVDFSRNCLRVRLCPTKLLEVAQEKDLHNHLDLTHQTVTTTLDTNGRVVRDDKKYKLDENWAKVHVEDAAERIRGLNKTPTHTDVSVARDVGKGVQRYVGKQALEFFPFLANTPDSLVVAGGGRSSFGAVYKQVVRNNHPTVSTTGNGNEILVSPCTGTLCTRDKPDAGLLAVQHPCRNSANSLPKTKAHKAGRSANRKRRRNRRNAEKHGDMPTDMPSLDNLVVLLSCNVWQGRLMYPDPGCYAKNVRTVKLTNVSNHPKDCLCGHTMLALQFAGEIVRAEGPQKDSKGRLMMAAHEVISLGQQVALASSVPQLLPLQDIKMSVEIAEDLQRGGVFQHTDFMTNGLSAGLFGFNLPLQLYYALQDHPGLDPNAFGERVKQLHDSELALYKTWERQTQGRELKGVVVHNYLQLQAVRSHTHTGRFDEIGQCRTTFCEECDNTAYFGYCSVLVGTLQGDQGKNSSSSNTASSKSIDLCFYCTMSTKRLLPPSSHQPELCLEAIDAACVQAWKKHYTQHGFVVVKNTVPHTTLFALEEKITAADERRREYSKNKSKKTNGLLFPRSAADDLKKSGMLWPTDRKNLELGRTAATPKMPKTHGFAKGHLDRPSVHLIHALGDVARHLFDSDDYVASCVDLCSNQVHEGCRNDGANCVETQVELHIDRCRRGTNDTGLTSTPLDPPGESIDHRAIVDANPSLQVLVVVAVSTDGPKFEIVPGSFRDFHRLNSQLNFPVGEFGEMHTVPKNPRHFLTRGARQLDLRKGDVVLWDDRCLHGRQPGTQGGSRKACMLKFSSAPHIRGPLQSWVPGQDEPSWYGHKKVKRFIDTEQILELKLGRRLGLGNKDNVACTARLVTGSVPVVSLRPAHSESTTLPPPALHRQRQIRRLYEEPAPLLYIKLGPSHTTAEHLERLLSGAMNVIVPLFGKVPLAAPATIGKEQQIKRSRKTANHPRTTSAATSNSAATSTTSATTTTATAAISSSTPVSSVTSRLYCFLSELSTRNVASLSSAYTYVNELCHPAHPADVLVQVVSLQVGSTNSLILQYNRYPESGWGENEPEIWIGHVDHMSCPHFVLLIPAPQSASTDEVWKSETGFYSGTVEVTGVGKMYVHDGGMYPWGNIASGKDIDTKLFEWCKENRCLSADIRAAGIKVQNCCSFTALLGGALFKSLLLPGGSGSTGGSGSGSSAAEAVPGCAESGSTVGVVPRVLFRNVSTAEQEAARAKLGNEWSSDYTGDGPASSPLQSSPPSIRAAGINVQNCCSFTSLFGGALFKSLLSPGGSGSTGGSGSGSSAAEAVPGCAESGSTFDSDSDSTVGSDNGRSSGVVPRVLFINVSTAEQEAAKAKLGKDYASDYTGDGPAGSPLQSSRGCCQVSTAEQEATEETSGSIWDVTTFHPLSLTPSTDNLWDPARFQTFPQPTTPGAVRPASRWAATMNWRWS